MNDFEDFEKEYVESLKLLAQKIKNPHAASPWMLSWGISLVDKGSTPQDTKFFMSYGIWIAKGKDATRKMQSVLDEEKSGSIWIFDRDGAAPLCFMDDGEDDGENLPSLEDLMSMDDDELDAFIEKEHSKHELPHASHFPNHDLLSCDFFHRKLISYDGDPLSLLKAKSWVMRGAAMKILAGSLEWSRFPKLMVDLCFDPHTQVTRDLATFCGNYAVLEALAEHADPETSQIARDVIDFEFDFLDHELNPFAESLQHL